MKRLSALPCCLLLALVAPLALSACDEEDDSVEALVDELISENNLQIEEACDCFAEFGYESRNACVDESGFVGPSLERCVKDAYSEDEAASRQYLNCVIPLEKEFSACANDRFVCDDLDGVQTCLDDYDLGLMECISLPGSVERDLGNCFPSQ